MTTEREKMLTPEEVASWLSVSRESVYRWIREGKLPAIRLGRLYRVPEREVLALISTGRATRLRDWIRALVEVAGDPLPGNLEPIMGELRDRGDERSYTLTDLRAEAQGRAATDEGLAAIEAAAELLDEEGEGA